MADPEIARLLEIIQDPDLVRRILDDQTNEQEIRKQEIGHTHEFSLRFLDAQLLDRQREREHQRSVSINAFLILGFLSLLLAVGICYALYLNKDQLVMEFLKAVLFLVTGGVGGYSLKMVKDKSDVPKQ